MSPFTRLYYSVKPLLPWSVRNALRRAHARRARHRAVDNWPIQRGSEIPPAGWSGWPDGKKFALVLTHDVEDKRGYQRIWQLAALEQEMGFRSAVNLIPEGPYRVTAELRSQLDAEGFEVGIHDLNHDGKLYRTREDFSRRARRINRYVHDWGATGFRSAFMHHNLEWLGELDVAYDASTFDTDPFEPQPDGVGTIFPFWVPRSSKSSPLSAFSSQLSEPSSSSSPLSALSLPLSDPSSGSPADPAGYVELPYTLVQDSTLFLFLGEQSIDCWKRKVDWIAEHGGMVLVNVHPDYISFSGRRSEGEFPVGLYRELLAYLRDRYGGQYWHALPRAVADHARTMRPVRDVRRPRRICMLSHSVYETDGRVIRYAETLAARGDNVEAVGLYPSTGSPQKTVNNGVSVFHILDRPGPNASKFSQLRQVLRFTLKASQLLLVRQFDRPFDLIHVHNIPDFLVFAAWLHRLCGGRVILDIHDVVPELYSNKFRPGSGNGAVETLKLVEKISCSFSDHVIIANHLWLDKVTQRSVAPGRCTPFINNVDTALFRPRDRTRRDDRQIMIFPGSLQWHQGLDIAIDAMALLRDELPALQFHVYGRGPALPDLMKQTTRLGLSDRVWFFPSRPLSEIVDLVANADLGIVPKRSDSFGNEAYSTKIMEFMAVGIPAVVSRTRIDTFYFNDDVVSFFEPQNPADLARAIKGVLQDNAYRRRLIENGLKYATENSWASVQHRYLAIVDRLLAA